MLGPGMHAPGLINVIKEWSSSCFLQHKELASSVDVYGIENESEFIKVSLTLLPRRNEVQFSIGLDTILVIYIISLIIKTPSW